MTLHEKLLKIYGGTNNENDSLGRRQATPKQIKDALEKGQSGNLQDLISLYPPTRHDIDRKTERIRRIRYNRRQR
jgi:hypothetical protein